MHTEITQCFLIDDVDSELDEHRMNELRPACSEWCLAGLNNLKVERMLYLGYGIVEVTHRKSHFRNKLGTGDSG